MSRGISDLELSKMAYKFGHLVPSIFHNDQKCPETYADLDSVESDAVRKLANLALKHPGFLNHVKSIVESQLGNAKQFSEAQLETQKQQSLVFRLKRTGDFQVAIVRDFKEKYFYETTFGFSERNGVVWRDRVEFSKTPISKTIVAGDRLLFPLPKSQPNTAYVDDVYLCNECLSFWKEDEYSPVMDEMDGTIHRIVHYPYQGKPSQESVEKLLSHCQSRLGGPSFSIQKCQSSCQLVTNELIEIQKWMAISDKEERKRMHAKAMLKFERELKLNRLRNKKPTPEEINFFSMVNGAAELAVAMTERNQ